MLNSELFDWVNKQKIINKLKIKKKDKDKLHKWHFNDNLFITQIKIFLKSNHTYLSNLKKNGISHLYFKKKRVFSVL